MKHVTRFFAVVAAIAALALVTCSDEKKPKADCKNDDDCVAGEVCENGTCVERQFTGLCGLCEEDAECGTSGVACAAIDAARTACVPTCDTAAPDCPTDFYCADGACIPTSGVCCVDLDGDTLGSGVDCTDVDCDDNNVNCTTDCTDADSDTYCITHDCDDANNHCDTDCTDSDSDDWCLGHDCNDSDPNATDVCEYCDIDNDGDLYGEGCPNGADCDDSNPHCNADCTDTDSDGWCLGIDCDDDNANCNADCTDVDSDGWCVVYDCDDDNANCNDSCIDEDRDTWCVGIDCDDALAHCDDDCTDVDGDGYCVTHDCNDVSDADPLVDGSHCAEDCTDSDTDGWCDDQDCDNSDPARNADCSGCTVDNDGDEYGPGCLLGADCDDNLPFCNTICTDVDGDSYCINYDCDEAVATVNPAAQETCNGVDDDCVNGIDDLPDAALCPPPDDTVYGTECRGEDLCRILPHPAGCAPNFRDLNYVFEDGCECQVLPPEGSGTSCLSPINVLAPGDGAFHDDTPVAIQVEGNIPWAGRKVWYKFRAQDDTSGEQSTSSFDNFKVHVSFFQNPANQFVFEVFRDTPAGGIGACVDDQNPNNQLGPLPLDPADGPGFLATELHWMLNEAGTQQACTPESCDKCPDLICTSTNGDCDDITECTNEGLTQCGPQYCTIHTADFWIGVQRDPTLGTDPTCDSFVLEISNGHL